MSKKQNTAKKATKKVTKKAPKKVTKKALKDAIGALAKSNIWKDVEKIAETLTYMVMEAFPNREYVRHAESMLKVSDYNIEICYTYVFEVDEGYYCIRTVADSGVYTIGPYDDFDYNQEEINLSVKAIREWVENFERKASGEEGADGKKYEFTGETKEVDGHTLHRIRALRKITDPNDDGWEISAGDLGGWIEHEKNLSHEGAAWVIKEACVYGDAKVYGNARVYGHAKVYDGAQVFGDAEVFDSAEVYGNAYVCGNADVGGYSEVKGDAQVYDSAEVYDIAKVYGNAEVCGDAQVYGDANVGGNTVLSEGCHNEGTHGASTDEPEETTEPETEETLTHRMSVLEGRVDKLADEMKATVKDIKDIKKKLNM